MFCSCDLDPMTLIYELDPTILNMNTKNELSRLSRVTADGPCHVAFTGGN